MIRHEGEGESLAVGAPIAPTAVLDGTYRFEYLLNRGRSTARRNPPPEGGVANSDRIWALRSTCKPKFCVATGTALDDQHKIADTPISSSVWHYVDSQWQLMPERHALSTSSASSMAIKKSPAGIPNCFPLHLKPAIRR